LFFLQPSQQRLLNSLNPVFVVMFVTGLILTRTTLEPIFPNVFRHWDLLLPFMVYFGQRRTLPEGLILALFNSHLYSLCSSAPIGVFALVYLVLFCIARLLSYVIYANTWVSILVLMFSLGLLTRILLYIAANVFGHGWHFFSFGNLAPTSLVFNAVMGYFVYSGLEWMDWFTNKVPRINIELGETGL